MESGYGAASTVEMFEACRPHLWGVAYGMLGSRGEAEDAVQECWLRLSRGGGTGIDDLRAWSTTVVGRICLDMLRARRNRREDYPGTWLPEPVVGRHEVEDPEQHAIAAEAIGLALLIVLDTLKPVERLAFVLHDVFAVPFDEVAPIVGRSPQAARQLASRARRRVRSAPRPDGDLARQRGIVDAFLAAAGNGDFEALMAALDPDVTLHLDRGPDGPATGSTLIGAEAVARHSLSNARRFLAVAEPVVVNGGPGTLAGDPAHPFGVAGFTIVDDRIVRIDIIADPDKLRGLGLDA